MDVLRLAQVKIYEMVINLPFETLPQVPANLLIPLTVRHF